VHHLSGLRQIECRCSSCRGAVDRSSARAAYAHSSFVYKGQSVAVKQVGRYTDLFSKPELWLKARQRVDVIKLGPGQAFTRADVTNDLATLQSVDAYRKMQQWNIDIAVEVPSVKEWIAAAWVTPRTHVSAGTPKRPRLPT
jgi:hypothetical protein